MEIQVARLCPGRWSLLSNAVTMESNSSKTTKTTNKHGLGNGIEWHRSNHSSLSIEIKKCPLAALASRSHVPQRPQLTLRESWLHFLISSLQALNCTENSRIENDLTTRAGQLSGCVQTREGTWRAKTQFQCFLPVLHSTFQCPIHKVLRRREFKPNERNSQIHKQGTSLMLYLNVTDFSLISPSSQEVSIELLMKACTWSANLCSDICEIARGCACAKGASQRPNAMHAVHRQTVAQTDDKWMSQNVTLKCHKWQRGQKVCTIASCWRSSTKYLGMPWSTSIQKHTHSQESTYKEGCKMMQANSAQTLDRVANLANNFNVFQWQHESFSCFFAIVPMSENVAKLRVCILVNASLGTDAEVAPARNRTLKLNSFDPQLQSFGFILAFKLMLWWKYCGIRASQNSNNTRNAPAHRH